MSQESRDSRRAAYREKFPLEIAQREKADVQAKLPPAPIREKFQTQDQFEEAMGYWQNSVGRIKAMADLALKNSQNQKQDTATTTGKPATRVLSRPLRADHPIFTRGFVVGQTVSMTTPPKKPKGES